MCMEGGGAQPKNDGMNVLLCIPVCTRNDEGRPDRTKGGDQCRMARYRIGAGGLQSWRTGNSLYVLRRADGGQRLEGTCTSEAISCHRILDALEGATDGGMYGLRARGGAVSEMAKK